LITLAFSYQTPTRYEDLEHFSVLIYAKKESICEQKAVDGGYCNSTQIGEFLLSPNATKSAQSLMMTKAIHLNAAEAPPEVYAIQNTGYYCIGTFAFTGDSYNVEVVFQNAYGELPAAQVAKLPFYGALTIVYAVLAAFWAFFYVQHRHDILAVQNYITAIVVFLIVEMLITWVFYDYQNRHGLQAGSKALLIVVGILNAARNSYSFFLLLIVCMGYSVVKPTLGKTMLYVRALAGCHFVFGLIYSIASLSITPDSAGPLVLFVIMPLAGTLTAFYVWTLNSLNLTIADLKARKQTAKAAMYRKLWYCLLISIIVIFASFFFNSVSFAGVSDPDFVPDHWRYRWFILDGWLNLVYLVNVAFICYVWLPTANNKRFAMSEEVCPGTESPAQLTRAARAGRRGRLRDSRLWGRRSGLGPRRGRQGRQRRAALQRAPALDVGQAGTAARRVARRAAGQQTTLPRRRDHVCH
jgi:hypothetical protein